MNCPYCGKEIYAVTGLQEIQKFQKHLRKCKKVSDSDRLATTDMTAALNARANSGQ
jgi:hypothetical protein